MKKLVAAFAIGLMACGSASAQEVQEQTLEVFSFSNDQEGDGGFAAPMIISSSSDDGSGSVMSSMRIMSPGDGQTMMFSGDAPFFGGGDDFSMLQNPSVQKDLELVDDQLEQVLDMQRRHGEQIRDALGDIRNGITPEGVERLQETIAALKDRQKDELNDLLLPHQQERLRQVALQMQMQSRGTAGALTSEQFAEELGITDEQKERLRERSQELQEELQRQYEELREQAKEELLSELTPEQRAKLDEMTGDEFEHNSQDWIEQFERQGGERRLQRMRGNDD
ncbi:MAG: hypothetical protein AAF456_04440 [Planctomycetota bacterium]